MDTTTYHLDDSPQLLVDNVLIECSYALTRRWPAPRRLDVPLIQRDQPSEGNLYFTYSNYAVIRDPADGLVKCWYEDLGRLQPDKGHSIYTAWRYAESRDGIHFTKPALDVAHIHGQPTNIVLGYVPGTSPTSCNFLADGGAHSNAIVLDPFPRSPEYRFRTLFSGHYPDGKGGHNRRITTAHSPDGIHWTRDAETPRFGTSGNNLSDVSCLFYDTDARLFVQNTRHIRQYQSAPATGNPSSCHWFAPYHPHRPDLMNKRRVFQSRSADFIHWTEPLPVSVPDDSIDNLDEAHYGMGQFRVGGHHFGTLGILRFTDNEMDVRLVHSRDGIHFHPCNRGNAWLAPRPGHWDSHMVSCTSTPIEQGDEWWFYHGGANNHHDWWMSPTEAIRHPEHDDPSHHVNFGLGLAAIRKEGFACLSSGPHRQGFMVTRPIMAGGERLLINASCRFGGSIRVEVRDPQDHVLSDLSADRCDPFTGDATAHPVTWQGNPVIPAGGWKKLVFLLRDADLYSFRFATPH